MIPVPRVDLVWGSGAVCVLVWLYFLLLVHPVMVGNARLMNVADGLPARFAEYRAAGKQYRVLLDEREQIGAALNERVERFGPPRSMSDVHLDVAQVAAAHHIALNQMRHPEKPDDDFIRGVQCFNLPLALSSTWQNYLVFRDALMARAPFIERESVRAAADGRLAVDVSLRWCRRGLRRSESL